MRGQFASIQAAVDAAQPGDWILIGPGDYHEQGDRDPRYASLARIGAGVMITKPDLHIRGMRRGGVVIDGTRPGSRRCSRAGVNQDFGPLDARGFALGRNGVEVWKAGGVTIENLTVCNFLQGVGDTGTQVWFNGGDGSGRIGLGAYRAAYVTATSTFFSAGPTEAAEYGIFTSNDDGPGIVTHSYASNMAQAAYYIGACRDCGQVLTSSRAEYSALGFLSTNAGGRLSIADSEWDHNRTGLLAVSENNEDAPSPQDGLCPRSASRSCTVYRDNDIRDNNDAQAPFTSLTSLAPVGAGMVIAGGRHDTVVRNRVTGNGSWGILLAPFLDTNSPALRTRSRCRAGVLAFIVACYYDDFGNRVAANTLGDNGAFRNPSNGDLAELSGPGGEGNCWQANVDQAGLTSTPAGLQEPAGQCGGAPGLTDPLFSQLLCADQTFGTCATAPGMAYPRPTRVRLHPLPAGLESMPDPCRGPPPNAFCQPARYR